MSRPRILVVSPLADLACEATPNAAGVRDLVELESLITSGEVTWRPVEVALVDMAWDEMTPSTNSDGFDVLLPWRAATSRRRVLVRGTASVRA